MKTIVDVIQVILNFSLDNSVASFNEQVYHFGKNTANKIVDIMGFNTTEISCNIISGVKYNGKDCDIFV